jgi:ribose transport system permease protein
LSDTHSTPASRSGGGALDFLSTTAVRSIVHARFLWAVPVVVIIVAAIALPAFRSSISVNSLLSTLAPIVIIAIGQAIVVMYGGIDLSVGAVAGLGTVVLALGPVLPGGAGGALVFACLAGLVVGIVNGLGVLAGINPLLMTFAMAGVVQGVALLLQSIPESAAPMGLIDAVNTSVGPVPLLAIVGVLLLVAAWFWLSQSRAGRVVQATGFNPRTAGRLGFPVRRTTLVVYGISGTLSALGGLAIVARTYTADALVGANSVIDSIATVLVAGIVITGGVGSLLSILPSAVIIAVVGQIITLTGTDAYYQTIFKGVLLVTAMGVYQLAGRTIRLPWRLSRSAAGEPIAAHTRASGEEGADR